MKTTLKKYTLITFFTLALLSYGFVIVHAAYPLTQWEPGETLDPGLNNPGCTPGSNNCSVATAWDMDLVNGYVFNDTQLVGIGTDTPTVELDVFGQFNVADSLVLEVSNNPADPMNDPSFLYTHQNIATTMSSDGDIDGQVIFNMNVATTWDSPHNMTNSSLANFLSTLFVDAGNLENVASGHFMTMVNGGSADRAAGLYTSAEFVGGAGSVNSLHGISANAINETGTPIESMIGGSFRSLTSGNTLELYGISGSVATQGDTATANFSRAMQVVNFAEDTSTIMDAGGILVRVAKFDMATIGSALGMEISAGLYAKGETGNEIGLYPGVGANGEATGIRMIASGLMPAIQSLSDTAYGIYIGDRAISGDTGQYALYIDDSGSENFFVNGMRIGTYADKYKINSISSGAGSNTLYIGNSTIDVTAPSDERTKENIIMSQLYLDDLMDIDMVDFTYDQSIVNDGGELHHGVLAQQVETVYPYAVTTRSDGYKMVDYKRFIPLIMKAMQDLQQQINNQAISLIDNVREIFVRKVTTEEFCMGNRCIDENQFNDLVDLLEEEDNQGADNEPVIENEIIEPIEESNEQSEEDEEQEGDEILQVPDEQSEEEETPDEQDIEVIEEETPDVTPVEAENDIEEETPVV